jgi:hypothetical protein
MSSIKEYLVSSNPLHKNDINKTTINMFLLELAIIFLILIGISIHGYNTVSGEGFLFFVLCFISGNLCIVILLQWNFFLKKGVKMELFQSNWKAFRYEEICFDKMVRTYAGLLNLPNQATIMDHGGNSFQEKFNIMIFQEMQRNRLLICMGIALTSVPLQIKPNYKDFLCKLNEVESTLPLSVQISFHNPQKSGDPTITYNLLFTQALDYSFSSRSLGDFWKSLEQRYEDFMIPIETNFPHFKFELLRGKALVDAIYHPFQVPGLENAFKPEKLGKTIGVPRKLVKFFILFATVIVDLYFLSIYASILTKNQLLLTLIGSAGLMVSLFGLLYYGSQAISRNGEEQCREIKLWAPLIWLRDKSTGGLGLYDPATKQMQQMKLFSFQFMDPTLNLNSNKLYRMILDRITKNAMAISMLHCFERFSTEDMVNIPQLLTTLGQDQWNGVDDTFPRNFTKEIAGFWKYQFLFTAVQSYKFHEENPEDQFEMNDQQLRQSISSLFKGNFPGCPILELPLTPGVWLQSIQKTRFFSGRQSKIPFHFKTGESIIPFFEIPEEIHRALVGNYPAEFSTPFLKDEILFGATLNPETGQYERDAGLNQANLTRNVLFAGHDRMSVMKNQARVGLACTEHQIPQIILDGDGDWVRYCQAIHRSGTLSQVKYLKVGSNFGLSLFDLPESPRVPLYTEYQEKLLISLRQIFHFSPLELALLHQVWMEMDPNNPIDVMNIQKKVKETYDSKTDFFLKQSPLNEYLTTWMQKPYLKIFGMNSANFIETGIVGDKTTTLVIDLSDLHEDSVKCLFIHAWLLQLYFRRIDHPKFEPKLIVLPMLEKLFPETDLKTDSSEKSNLIQEMNKKGFQFSAATTHVDLVAKPILHSFGNLFFSAMVDSQQVNCASSLLRLDEVFTNTISNNPRKVSYQANFFKNMDANLTIVSHLEIKLPYLCAFEYGSLDSEINSTEMQYTQLPEIQQSLIQDTEKEIQCQVGSKSLLEWDFPTDQVYYAKLIFFLEEVVAMQSIQPVQSLPSLQSKLASILMPIFQEDSIPALDSKKIVTAFMNNFIAKGYFRQESIVLKENNYDFEGYAIQVKAEDIIADWNTRANLSPLSQNTETPILPVEETLSKEAE